MKQIDIIKACTDLGVHKDGADLGPEIICNNMISSEIHAIYEVKKPICTKELEYENKKKNLKAVNQFNQELYHTVFRSIQDGNIPLTMGGDHSLAIASCLASKKHCENMGLIWFDAHADFNTFQTTITGNIHGLPFACITGQNGNELSPFFDGKFYDPQKCVLIGARSIDYPGEIDNLHKAGIHIYTSEDIKKYGTKAIFDKAVQIVTGGTEGFHFSIDTDVMDPVEAPGVSIPERNGISSREFLEMIQLFLDRKNLIRSIDLVEYNPKYDIENCTLAIVTEAVNEIIHSYHFHNISS